MDMLDNWNATSILLALAIAWAGYQLIIALAMMVRLLRVPIWPIDMRAVDADKPLTGTPGELALLDELRGLGFEPVWHGEQSAGPRSFAAVLLRHADGLSYASLSFQPTPLTVYPVTFCSFDAQREVRVTTNRIGWFVQSCRSEVRYADAYADDLAGHFATHRLRLADAVVLDTDDAVARLLQGIKEGYARMLAAGSLRGGDTPDHPAHLTLRTAWRCALAFMRVRRRLARPYVCAATAGEHRRSYFLACFSEMEQEEATRPPRPNLKAGVLVLSMASALLLWTWAFDWRQALALVAILLIHECGHAIAMRAFGWKDLTMFFVPFVGAIVTGRPRETATWQQVVVLLAGPLPGLIAGLALLLALAPAQQTWHMVATMAVMINLFNLLPVTPLDGGRLVESALFARWPRARIAFLVLSITAFLALAIWLESKPVLIITLFLAIGLPHQLRLARLQSAWQDGLPREQQIGQLYDAATRGDGKRNLSSLIMTVKSVLALKHVYRPRLAESVLSIAVLAGVWIGSGLVLSQTLFADGMPHLAEQRTSAQTTFDIAWAAATDLEEAGARQRVLDGAAALETGDPRQIDVLVWLGRELDPAARRGRIETVLRGGRDGLVWKRADILRELLDDEARATREQPPLERVQRLRNAIDWAEHAEPAMLAPTISTRLRLAEAVDASGNAESARRMLLELRERAATADDCRCELSHVVRAQAWYHLKHDEATQALQVLEASPLATEMTRRGGRLALDYGWAMLLAGRNDDAVNQMRIATQARVADDAAVGAKAGAAKLRHPLELAHTLRASGRGDEAKRIVEQEHPWDCTYYAADESSVMAEAEPWQQARSRALRDSARALCPPEPGRTAP